MTKHATIDLLALFLEGTSMESVQELDDQIDAVALSALVLLLSTENGDTAVTRAEAKRAARGFCRLVADRKITKGVSVRDLRQAAESALEATTALLDLLEGRNQKGGERFPRALGKVFAIRGTGAESSVNTMADALRNMQQSLHFLIEHFPAHRWPNVLEARFIANEAGRFQRLTGQIPTKTRDPTADADAMTGPFADYLRGLEGVTDTDLVFTETDIRTGLDLWRTHSIDGPQANGER